RGRDDRADEPRQPARDTGARTGRAGGEADGLALGHRATSAAGRRSGARCPDIGLARRVLGWEPTVTLEDGLERAVGYFRRMLEKSAIGVKAEAARASAATGVS